jgi:hypothetical protein
LTIDVNQTNVRGRDVCRQVVAYYHGKRAGEAPNRLAQAIPHAWWPIQCRVASPCGLCHPLLRIIKVEFPCHGVRHQGVGRHTTPCPIHSAVRRGMCSHDTCVHTTSCVFTHVCSHNIRGQGSSSQAMLLQRSQSTKHKAQSTRGQAQPGLGDQKQQHATVTVPLAMFVAGLPGSFQLLQLLRPPAAGARGGGRLGSQRSRHRLGHQPADAVRLIVLRQPRPPTARTASRWYCPATTADWWYCHNRRRRQPPAAAAASRCYSPASAAS